MSKEKDLGMEVLTEKVIFVRLNNEMPASLLKEYKRVGADQFPESVRSKSFVKYGRTDRFPPLVLQSHAFNF